MSIDKEMFHDHILSKNVEITNWHIDYNFISRVNLYYNLNN